MRTLRSRSRWFVPALVGSGALLAGFLLLSYGMQSKGSAAPSSGKVQLAAAERGDEKTANRGSGRTRLDPGSEAMAVAATGAALTSPADEVDPTTTTVPPTTTTVAPTTTTTATTAKPKLTTTTARPRSAAAPAAPTNIGDDVWARLARCESGGNPRSVGGGGKYFGAFQFTLGTWHSLGFSGSPIDYSYEDQVTAAKRLQARSGWGQWPVCSRAALG